MPTTQALKAAKPATTVTIKHLVANPAEEASMIKRFGGICLMIGASFALTATGANAASPIPIKFAAGSYGAVVNGHVSAGNWLQTYKLNVAAGQVMILTFAGAVGPMRGQVQCQGGVGGGPYYGAGDSITITTSGECDITVGGNTMAEPQPGGFTLAVLVYTPSKSP
jgi:hypothetical protein